MIDAVMLKPVCVRCLVSISIIVAVAVVVVVMGAAFLADLLLMERAYFAGGLHMF